MPRCEAISRRIQQTNTSYEAVVRSRFDVAAIRRIDEELAEEKRSSEEAKARTDGGKKKTGKDIPSPFFTSLLRIDARIYSRTDSRIDSGSYSLSDFTCGSAETSFDDSRPTCE